MAERYRTGGPVAHDFRWTYLGDRCLRCWTWKADATEAPCPGRKVVPLMYAPTPCPRCGKRLCVTAA